MKRTPEQWVEFWSMRFTRNVGTPMKDILAAFSEAVRAEALTEAADNLRKIADMERMIASDDRLGNMTQSERKVYAGVAKVRDDDARIIDRMRDEGNI